MKRIKPREFSESNITVCSSDTIDTIMLMLKVARQIEDSEKSKSVPVFHND